MNPHSTQHFNGGSSFKNRIEVTHQIQQRLVGGETISVDGNVLSLTTSFTGKSLEGLYRDVQRVLDQNGVGHGFTHATINGETAWYEDWGTYQKNVVAERAGESPRDKLLNYIRRTLLKDGEAVDVEGSKLILTTAEDDRSICDLVRDVAKGLEADEFEGHGIESARVASKRYFWVKVRSDKPADGRFIGDLPMDNYLSGSITPVDPMAAKESLDSFVTAYQNDALYQSIASQNAKWFRKKLAEAVEAEAVLGPRPVSFADALKLVAKPDERVVDSPSRVSGTFTLKETKEKKTMKDQLKKQAKHALKATTADQSFNLLLDILEKKLAASDDPTKQMIAAYLEDEYAREGIKFGIALAMMYGAETFPEHLPKSEMLYNLGCYQSQASMFNGMGALLSALRQEIVPILTEFQNAMPKETQAMFGESEEATTFSFAEAQQKVAAKETK